MCLDECPPHETPPEYLRVAVERTLRWAERCRAAHRRPDQALFAIVQGGTDLDLRAHCARELTAMDFPGYALGGFSVGETAAQMVAALGPTAALLPADKPRYLDGRRPARGHPRRRARAASTCSIACCRRATAAMPRRSPTRARSACATPATSEIRGRLESDCPCYVCRHFSRAYLHHLFLAKEMLGPTLLSLHNVAFYCRLMADIRAGHRGAAARRVRAQSVLPAGANRLKINPFIRDAATDERWFMLHALIVLAEEEGKQPRRRARLCVLAAHPHRVSGYLLLIRPLRRQEQERQALASNLKKNDEVLTNAGIYGTVVDVSETDDKITVKVDDNVRVKMTKGSVARNLTNEEAAKQAKEPKEAKA